MKQSFKFAASLATGAITLMAAAPAFAHDYSSSSSDAAASLFGCGTLACMIVPGILLTVLWVWMLIDVIGRQEYEFPNSSGNSKLIWILLIVFLNGIAPIIYYFMVYKKIKRGTMAAPGAPMGYAPPAPPGSYAPPAPPAPPAYQPQLLRHARSSRAACTSAAPGE